MSKTIYPVNGFSGPVFINLVQKKHGTKCSAAACRLIESIFDNTRTEPTLVSHLVLCWRQANERESMQCNALNFTEASQRPLFPAHSVV